LRPYQILDEIDQVKLTVNIETIIKFLVAESYLHSVKFYIYRPETVYFWRSVTDYQLLPAIKPKGYYSHLSAVYFHDFIEIEPDNHYFNNEQPKHGTTIKKLEQNRIDLAFANMQRVSSARISLNGKIFWCINGKQTGNYGVVQKKISTGVIIPVTNLERTLVDIVVRPMYAGGPKQILRVFQLAKSKISILRLTETLRALDYIYPYHQSIGFYLERAEVCDRQEIDHFLNFEEIRYDFYLDYHMHEPKYCQKWRLFYPAELDEK
jgi:hypothetical protein